MKRIVLFVALLFPCLGTWASESDSLLLLNYHWDCSGEEKECSLEVDSRLLDYYRNEREHIAYNYEASPYGEAESYFSFMFSEYDRAVIRDLVSKVCNSEAIDRDKVKAAMTFVQALPYALDAKSVGQDEYVRYPLETLVDKEGDCEDKVALLGAMLKELGVEFVLLKLPDHLAVGVSCDSVVSDQCLVVGDRRYYFVETTTPRWEIGQIPSELAHLRIEVVPCSFSPVLVSQEMRFESQPTLIFMKAQCSLWFRLKNVGPGTAKGIRLHVMMLKPSFVGQSVLMEETFMFEDLAEGMEREETVEFKSVIGSDETLRLTLVAEDVPAQEFEMKLKTEQRR